MKSSAYNIRRKNREDDFMGDKGLDFKHKEVINIKDGKRLRTCARCMCGFGNRKNNIYNCSR